MQCICVYFYKFVCDIVDKKNARPARAGRDEETLLAKPCDLICHRTSLGFTTFLAIRVAWVFAVFLIGFADCTEIRAQNDGRALSATKFVFTRLNVQSFFYCVNILYEIFWIISLFCENEVQCIEECLFFYSREFRSLLSLVALIMLLIGFMRYMDRPLI